MRQRDLGQPDTHESRSLGKRGDPLHRCTPRSDSDAESCDSVDTTATTEGNRLVAGENRIMLESRAECLAGEFTE